MVEPELYLPPLPRWFKEAAPSEGWIEPSVLYEDEFYDDPNVREALRAIGRYPTLTGRKPELEDENLPPIDEEKAKLGAEMIRDRRPMAPPGVRKPAAEFLKLKNFKFTAQTHAPALRSLPLAHTTNEQSADKRAEETLKREAILASHNSAKNQELSETAAMLEAESPDSDAARLLKLAGRMSARLDPDGETLTIKETKDFQRELNQLVEDVLANPKMLPKLIGAYWSINRYLKQHGEGKSIASPYINDAMWSIVKKLGQSRYTAEAFTPAIIAEWLNILNVVPGDAEFKNEEDANDYGRKNQPAGEAMTAFTKAIPLLINTFSFILSQSPEQIIDTIYLFARQGFDPNHKTKANSTANTFVGLMKTVPLLDNVIRTGLFAADTIETQLKILDLDKIFDYFGIWDKLPPTRWRNFDQLSKKDKQIILMICPKFYDYNAINDSKEAKAKAGMSIDAEVKKVKRLFNEKLAAAEGKTDTIYGRFSLPIII